MSQESGSTMETTHLERTLVEVVEQHLRELRAEISTASQPASGGVEMAGTADEMWRVAVFEIAGQVRGLTHIGHLRESGLSDAGSRRLLELESECSALMRTFGWVSGKL